MKNVVLDGPTPDTCYLELTQGKQVLVDRADLPLLADRRWYAQKNHNGRGYYSVSSEFISGQRIKTTMHTWLMPGRGVVRHLNGEGLDNRRVNLARGSQRKNQQERYTHLAGRLPGCTWRNDNRLWQARVSVGGRRRSAGCFKTEVEAFLAYWQLLVDLGLDTPDLQEANVAVLLNHTNERIRRAYDTPRLRPA